MQQLVVLGSTGSIGRSTLEVVAANRERFSLLALVGGKNVDEMVRQCCRFQPRFAALADPEAALQLRHRLKTHSSTTSVVAGDEAIISLATLSEADQVVAAIVGVAGLFPTLAAIHAGKRVLLANKESLVTCGRLLMEAVQNSGAELIPIDSEHSAIFQCLPPEAQRPLGQLGLADHGVRQLILTASGGPFRLMPLEELVKVSPEQACDHPNWSMGRKVSVDSATMMNKGLEYIEARWMFNAHPEQLTLLLHPESLIHSMVAFVDGSLLLQGGYPDMRTPIGYALCYPDRAATGVAQFDFSKNSTLNFAPMDAERFPCVGLAIDACTAGQAFTTALNAANEVAVEAFLQRKIRFTDIFRVNHTTLSTINEDEPKSLHEVLNVDRQARVLARQEVDRASTSVCWSEVILSC